MCFTAAQKREQPRTDLICIAGLVLLPSPCSQLILRLRHFFAFSRTPPALRPLEWILVDISSSRFVVFCCPCRSRSLRPASESAENGHLVSEVGSVTPLTHAQVVLREIWDRVPQESLACWKLNWWRSLLQQLFLCGLAELCLVITVNDEVEVAFVLPYINEWGNTCSWLKGRLAGWLTTVPWPPPCSWGAARNRENPSILSFSKYLI